MNSSIVQPGRIAVVKFEGTKEGLFKVCIRDEGYKQKLDVFYISPQAPLAQAILNHKVGEKVEYRVKNNIQQVVILGIQE